MQTLAQDLRFALRQLRKSPGFTLLAALTLAIGIGAATAVFSLVDAVLLRPLPFPDPNRVVALDTLERPSGSTGAATKPDSSSYPDFYDWRTRARSFDAMASWQGAFFTYRAPNAPARRFQALMASSDIFRVMGVYPILGRAFTRAEEQAGNRSIILSNEFWKTAFNADPAVLGKTLKLNTDTYTIVGVMPAHFSFPGAELTEAWVTPATTLEGGDHASGKQRGWHQVSVLARLAPGVSIAQAHAEMQAIQLSLANQYPGDDLRDTDASVTPELKDVVGDIQRPLKILFSAVCSLLFIACANVAGLLLTRTAARRPELAIRAALGASRVQIIRQLLIEALTLSTLGGAIGFALAAAALRIAPQYLPANLPRVSNLSLSPPVFAFALAISIATGLLFGVLPAWRVSRLDPALALRDNSRSNTASRGQQRLHAALVIGETALSLVLIVSAGLLIRSFNKLLNVNPGFDPSHLLTFHISVPDNHFTDQQGLQFSQQLQARLAALPGVQQASYGFPFPMAGGSMGITFDIEGHPTAPGDEPDARAAVVASNYFSILKVPLESGRLFTPAEDQPNSPPVVIINQALARKFFPGENAIGKRIKPGLSADDKPAPMREIVGIVGDTSLDSLANPAEAQYFVPFAQAQIGGPVYAIRTAGDPAQFTDTVRTLVAQLDPSLPVYNIRTYANLLARNTAQQRFQTQLLTAFALIALLLACVGLYSVLSYMVTQRTQELGLRMALGAQRSDVLTLILKRGLTFAVIGLILGLGASALLTKSLAALLYRTQPLDFPTFAATTALLLALSVVACIAPAYRASRLDPNETLRQQ
jgi:putative ABC transport system permease protein